MKRLLAIALLIAACGEPATSPTPTTTPVSDGSSGQATANPNLTPAPLPDRWTYVSWSDPDLEIGVPGDWQTRDPTETLNPSATEGIGSITPEQLDAIIRLNSVIQWGNEMARSGSTRLMSLGNVEMPPGTLEDASVSVFVESGDASIEDFTNRQLKLDQEVFGVDEIDQSTVVLPAGLAVRLAYSVEGWGGDTGVTEYSEVDYLFMLPDGRSMTVAVSGSGGLSDVSAFAAKVIATLRPTK
jgi:hypothetical protein